MKLLAKRTAILGLSTLGVVLLTLLIVLLVWGLPVTGLHGFGYAPSGLITVLLIVLVVLIIAGKV